MKSINSYLAAVVFKGSNQPNHFVFTDMKSYHWWYMSNKDRITLSTITQVPYFNLTHSERDACNRGLEPEDYKPFDGEPHDENS